MKIRFNRDAQYIGRECNSELEFNYVCILPCIEISWKKKEEATIPLASNFFDLEDIEDTPPPKKKSQEVSKQ